MRRAPVVLTAVITVAAACPWLVPGAVSAVNSPASPGPAVIEPTAAFEGFACPEDLPLPDRDVECGFVTVPEDRDVPAGRTIKVAAMVVRAADPDPAADPILYLPGGPSAGAITPFTLAAYLDGAPYGEDRDIVLVDPRGTGLSRPRLGCRELDRADTRSFYGGRFIYDRSPELTGRAAEACWNRLTARGIDLAAYTSAESAADLEALREALGVARWNVLALSAGGTLGMTYQRLFPASIRSVVIDSGIPSNSVWGPDFLRGSSRVAMRVLNGCRDDAVCDARYPGLRRKFLRVVRESNEDPFLVPIPAFRPEPVAVPMDGGTLMTDLAFAAWPGGGGSPSEIPGVIAVAWDVANGRIGRVYRGFLGTGPYENHDSHFTAQGASLSYVCHDLVGFLTRADRREAAEADPAHARRILGRQYDLGQGWNNFMSPEGCRHWPVGRAEPEQHATVVSAVPTLVLGASYDAVVPPFAVRRALPGLVNGTYVEMPTSAHVVLATFSRGGWCARRITAAFIEDPAAEPDTSCLADLSPVDFSPRSRVEQRWSPRAVPSLGPSPGPPLQAARPR